jgi:hypothetical protein
MEHPAAMLGPSQFQREGIVKAQAQKNSYFGESFRKSQQSDRPYVLREHLNGTTFDDDIKRSRTHSDIQEVAGQVLIRL